MCSTEIVKKANVTEQRLDQMSEGGLSNPAESEGRQGDAELCSREVGVEVLRQSPTHLCTSGTLRLELGELSPSHFDDRELCRDEVTVRQDEHQ
jgi:hypothetical protein